MVKNPHKHILTRQVRNPGSNSDSVHKSSSHIFSNKNSMPIEQVISMICLVLSRLAFDPSLSQLH